MQGEKRKLEERVRQLSLQVTSHEIITRRYEKSLEEGRRLEGIN